ncbi:MAG: TrkH family potassium uptake protein [Desulfobacterales bacterium]
MRALRYAVRPLPVLKYFGQLCFVLGLLTLVPLTVALIAGDSRVSVRYAMVASGILVMSAALMRLPSVKRLQSNEAMVIAALVFLFIPLVMTWPMMAAGLSFSDALFETISAVTTTGLSLVADVSDKPATYLFARSWMQWVGGLGIVVLSLAIMIQPGTVAKRLGEHEDFEDDTVVGTRLYARLVFVIYFVLTGVGIILLGLLGVGWFRGLTYAFTAVSTGGFSPHDNSLVGLDGYPAKAAVILLSMAGGVSLMFYRRLFKDRWRAVTDDVQLRSFLVLSILFAAMLAWSLRMQGFAWPGAVGHGVLNAFSAQSTAGFSTIDLSQIDSGSKLILIGSMFIGGSVGSTSGGIKILRLLILMRMLSLLIERPGMPHNAVVEKRLGRRRLEPDEIQNALSLIVIFVMVIMFSWVPFVFMGYRPLDSLFEVVSAIGTVGLSTGITAPDLPPFLKGVLCMDMLLGRLEVLAWLIFLYPGTWFGRRMEG